MHLVDMATAIRREMTGIRHFRARENKFFRLTRIGAAPESRVKNMAVENARALTAEYEGATLAARLA
jgi:hypothetical protein